VEQSGAAGQTPDPPEACPAPTRAPALGAQDPAEEEPDLPAMATLSLWEGNSGRGAPPSLDPTEEGPDLPAGDPQTRSTCGASSHGDLKLGGGPARGEGEGGVSGWRPRRRRPCACTDFRRCAPTAVRWMDGRGAPLEVRRRSARATPGGDASAGGAIFRHTPTIDSDVD